MRTKNDSVKGYLDAKNNLRSFFGCEEDYHMKPLLDSVWAITDDDGYVFLKYEEGGMGRLAAVVRKDGAPLLYDAGAYTLVIALDCVKTGFILSSDKRKGQR